MPRQLLFLFAWCIAWGATALRAEPGAPIAAARLAAGEAIRLDGSLDHPAWQRAPVHDGFVQKLPEVGEPPRHATEVRILFDEVAVYVGVRAHDPDPSQIRAPLVRHDRVNRTQDFVVVYFDAIGSRQSAQFFRVNAAGSTGDGMHTAADDSEDFAPDFDFDAAVRRDAGGYTAVFRIPFASLRFSGDGPPAWRVMVARRVPRDQFYMYTSVLVPRDAPNFIAALQPLQGVELPQRHQFLVLRPSFTARHLRSATARQPDARRSDLDASLDVKWRPRPEWVIDATLNPDFSQVALDVPQLSGNTRFALQYPEKRPFFFESSDLLRSPTEALYTRSFTEPRWGLRSTWRGNQLAGTAFAIDDRGGGLVLLPGPWGTGAAAQPASQSLATRWSFDAGAVQWGALAAIRRYADGRGSNAVWGPEVGWQIDDAWRLRAQVLGSDTTALPDAAGELWQQPAIRGRRSVVKVNWQGDHADANLVLDESDAGFRNDSGFTAENSVRGASGAYNFGWSKVGPFNEFWLGLRFEHKQEHRSGQRLAQDVSPGVWFTGASNLEVYLNLHPDAQLRTRSDGPLLHQRHLSFELMVTPATWAPYLTASGKLGRLADVQADQVRPGGQLNLALTTRPLSRLELEPSVWMAWLDRDGRRTYHESVTQWLAVWHLDAHQSIRGIWQRTSLHRQAEAGVPAALDRSQVGSLTWAWHRTSGQVLYIGVTRQRRGLGLGERDNEVFVKWQTDMDEWRRAF